jgi:hypothetical protein
MNGWLKCGCGFCVKEKNSASITLEQYLMGRDTIYPSEYTPELQKNAIALVAAINAFMSDLGWEGSLKVSSGWRPAIINANTPGAAKKSKHQTCNACDLVDDKAQTLGFLVSKNHELLKKHGLFLENIASTRGWVHLQNIAPKSGNIIFLP